MGKVLNIKPRDDIRRNQREWRCDEREKKRPQCPQGINGRRIRRGGERQQGSGVEVNWTHSALFLSTSFDEKYFRYGPARL